MAYFVFSHGVLSRVIISSFRVALFAWRLFVFSRGFISSFRVALFRLFVVSRGVFSSFRLPLFRLFVNSSFRLYCVTDIRLKKGSLYLLGIILHLNDKFARIN